jgi:hypothetical protein
MAHRPDGPPQYDSIAVKRLAQAICGLTLVPKKEVGDVPRPS